MIKKSRTTSEVAEPYYKQVERAVELVERAVTHYDALGIDPQATDAQIHRAHQRAVTVLNPLIFKAKPDVPIEMQTRIDHAFHRVTTAFSVLGNIPRRREYDKIFQTVPQKPNPENRETENKAAENKAASVNQTGKQEKTDPKADLNRTRNRQSDNLRKSERLKLVIPARITGVDRNGGEWREESDTLDVSRTGIRLYLKKRVRHRSVVHLLLPLPLELRSHEGTEKDYNVYALVRRVEPPRNGRRVVALEFLGVNPPAGYAQKPWATFRTKWTGADRRRKPREEKSVRVVIEYLDEAMKPVQEQEAFTENVSASGMRICLKVPAPEFDMVKVIIGNQGAESLAALSDRYFHKDGFERLCLRFIGNISASAMPVSKRGAKSQRILVADDDPPLRKVLGKILTDAGYDVLLAEDGQLAVEMAAREKPNLVIVDGLMPKLHGFLACKAIKELPSPPKVIMLTAVYTKKNYRWEARDKYHADDFLTKPFELAELLACIEKHLSA